MLQAAQRLPLGGRPLPAGAGRLRVMHVVPSLDPGGTERLVIEISKTLMDDVHPTVCCLDTPGGWAGELTDLGIQVVALRRPSGFRPSVGLAIGRLADQHQIDVLHCHHYSPFVYGRIAAAGRSLGMVYTEHGRASDDGPSWKRRLVNPMMGRLPATICAVSADLRRYMISEGLPGDRIRVIHNGIAFGKRPSAVARSTARLALGLAQNAFVVGAAGRLDPVKDLETLIRATAALLPSQPTLHVVIIGEGGSRSDLEQMIAAANLAGVVTLTGYRSDVRALMPAFDVYANTSTHEGVSLTILEAMAAALPVVATRVGGTPEVVVDGETGILVPARAPEQFAVAVAAFARAGERRCTAGDAGRRRIESHFSLDAMTGAYLQAYRGLAES